MSVIVVGGARTLEMDVTVAVKVEVTELNMRVNYLHPCGENYLQHT